MTTRDELLDYLFDGKNTRLAQALYPEFESWLQNSRRFQAFVTSYRDKIRAKLKNVRDDGGIQDLRAELEAALLLLGQERFTLEYEKYAASKQRGPDFTVTFKTHTPFNVEARRLRNVELDDGNADARTIKLMAVLCEKVGQMPPSSVNLLWLTAEREISEADLVRGVLELRQRAERKAEDFFMRRGFANAADFIKQYRQLSGIVLHQAGKSFIWLNSIARHPAPPQIVTALSNLYSK